MKRFAELSFIIILFQACAPPNKFNDKVLISIADYQDKRQADSLQVFFHSEDPIYRAASALAFASLQDTIASPGLGSLLLEDPDVQVRINAAYALGQTGGIAAVNALIPAITSQEPMVVREVLEALGKTAGVADLDVLKTFNAIDTLTQEGLARAFYRLGLRKLSDSSISFREGEFLDKKYTLLTRRAAANFFGRVSYGNPPAEKLIAAALGDPSPEVRMAAALGLRRINQVSALEAIAQVIRNDHDPRVRINAIRACEGFSLKDSQAIVFGALNDPATEVQIAASELLITLAAKNPFKRIAEDIADCPHPRVKANLYSALLNSLQYGNTVKEIIDLYHHSDTYGKVYLLQALGFANGSNEEEAFDFLSATLLGSRIPAIRSAATQSLVAYNDHPGLDQKKRERHANLYRKAMAGGDPAVIGIIAGAMADSAFRYRETVTDFTFLYEAKKHLQLPRDVESLQPLVRAIAYFERKGMGASLKNEYNHRIDWKLVRTIPRDQVVRIKTNRGDITVRLFVESSPGSVGNFVDLVGQKYFDGKRFHRVVPNFVIQAGCNRGDGFGSEDYSIRSEFSPRRYGTGSMGFASAGKDTECTQWFITHSPTPHLDGRYSLFGEVEKGMETVDRTEVGDSIISVTLEKN